MWYLSFILKYFLICVSVHPQKWYNWYLTFFRLCRCSLRSWTCRCRLIWRRITSTSSRRSRRSACAWRSWRWTSTSDRNRKTIRVSGPPELMLLLCVVYLLVLIDRCCRFRNDAVSRSETRTRQHQPRAPPALPAPQRSPERWPHIQDRRQVRLSHSWCHIHAQKHSNIHWLSSRWN